MTILSFSFNNIISRSQYEGINSANFVSKPKRLFNLIHLRECDIGHDCPLIQTDEDIALVGLSTKDDNSNDLDQVNLLLDIV